ncbi:MAG: hypothetical protein II074_05175, partial [Ruminococcus sp.]|nr:hypothetical protein [Ruminococcus sp.]
MPVVTKLFRFPLQSCIDKLQKICYTETLQKHSYAGVILFSQNTETNAGTTRFVDALQKANAAGGDRPQLLISTDQEGGNVTRLTQGTMTPGNMALGAINDVNITKEIAAL